MRRDAAQAPGRRRAPGGLFPQLRPQLLLHLTAFPLAPPSPSRPRSARTAPTPLHTSRLRRRRPRPPGTRPSRGRDVPRRPRGGPRPAARLGRLGSGSGTRRDTEGHGGAQAQLPATVLSPETRLVRWPRRPLSPTWLTLTATLGVTRGVTHGSHGAAPGITHGSAQTDKGGGAGGARARLRVEHSPAEVTSARSGGLSDVATSCSLLFPDRSKPFSASHPTGHSSANPGGPLPQLEGPLLQVSVPM